MLSYETAIGKLKHYIGKNVLVRMPHGHKEMVVIFDWDQIMQVGDAGEVPMLAIPTRRTVESMIDLYVNSEARRKMNANKWGLFAFAGICESSWDYEDLSDLDTVVSLFFDLENNDGETCPVICAFAQDEYRPAMIASRIEDLLIEAIPAIQSA